MTKRILHVVTNVAHYADQTEATGLWLGELTHAYDEFEQRGYLQDIVSPLGGQSPIEPKSLKKLIADASVMKRYHDPEFMRLLEHTLKPSDVDWRNYDAIYFTGGHGVMWDFLDQAELQQITQNMYEHGKIISSVCHGYCALLQVKLSNGQYLIQGKHVTGFAWTEEVLAGVSKKVPYNAEQMAKDHGALYTKKMIPFAPNVVTDGQLITGQNPFSARPTALAVIQALEQAA